MDWLDPSSVKRILLLTLAHVSLAVSLCQLRSAAKPHRGRELLPALPLVFGISKMQALPIFGVHHRHQCERRSDVFFKVTTNALAYRIDIYG